MKNSICFIILFLSLQFCSAQIANNEFYVTPENFGCISDSKHEASNNSRRLQAMIDFAIKNGCKIISKSEKHYYIAKGIYVSHPISIEFNRSTLIATDSVDMITFLRKDSNNKLYNGVVSGLYLDLNKIAKSGIRCQHVVKIRFTNNWIYNIPSNAVGVKVDKGSEMFFDNIHFEGGEKGAYGIKIDTHDCHFSDCVMINCYVAVDNNGSNFFERIHAWMEKGTWIPGGAFFNIRGGRPIFLHQCFSDTFDKSFQIECKTNLFISQHKNYHNKQMWKREADKIQPLFLHFSSEEVAKNSQIVLDNSYIGGLYIDGKNRQSFSNIDGHHIIINSSYIE